jgi:hypothetical protein
MHIDTIPNRNSRPAYLLRESYREEGRVRKRTLANLSSLPIEQIEAIRRILKGERLGAGRGQPGGGALARILAPEASKLGMTRAWADTTLAGAGQAQGRETAGPDHGHGARA